jgi:ADP-ribose pyrophosphatase YjhB (NUDIX family)
VINFCPRCATPVAQRRIEGTLRHTCPACGYIHFADPKVAATVLITWNRNVLLVRRAVDPQRGLWSLPGGYVNFGEDPLDAARRECWEEVAIKLDELVLLDVAFGSNVIVITYVAQLSALVTPVPADDADRADWFTPDDLPPLAFPTIARAVDKWKMKA